MKIALDIDGVLADFHKGVYEYFGKCVKCLSEVRRFL